MLPELGQWAVTVTLLSNRISAKKRLYRFNKMPQVSFGQLSEPFEFILYKNAIEANPYHEIPA